MRRQLLFASGEAEDQSTWLRTYVAILGESDGKSGFDCCGSERGC